MVDAITYDDIYELLRTEKNNADLQPLDSVVLDKVGEYLKAKRLLLKQQPTDVFSGAKQRAKILTEIENAKQVMYDLFEKRERKVINRALYTVRTNSKLKDTTNMLASEEEIYKALLKLLSEDKSKFLALIGPSASHIEQKAEQKAPVKEGIGEQPLLERDAGERKESIKTAGSNVPTPTAAELMKKKTEAVTKKIKIKILKDIPELIDSELNRHGPYKAGSEAELPNELADLLVKQEKAEPVKSEA